MKLRNILALCLALQGSLAALPSVQAAPDPNAPPAVPVDRKNLPAAAPALPLDSSTKATVFFLSLPDVQRQIASRPGDWWTQASSYSSSKENVEWVLVLGNGKGACASSHQCNMRLKPNGQAVAPLRCSDGWNCK